MRDEDRVRLLHMIEAAEAVAQFLTGRSRDDFDQDQMLRFAVEPREPVAAAGRSWLSRHPT
jgi:uncharacterized protein with HEPN domain